MLSLLPVREKVAEGRMRGSPAARRSTLTRPGPASGSRATSPGLGRGDTVLSLLPVREKVAEGRMRGSPAAQAVNPHPPGPRQRVPSDLSRGRER